MTSTVTPEEPNLENFWTVESVGTNVNVSSVDFTFLRAYQQSSITQTPEGEYIARFPWKEDRLYLPTNVSICKNRTMTLIHKTHLMACPKIIKLMLI